MRLYLVRHGESESSSINPDRSLTSDGDASIQRIAEYLINKSFSLKAGEVVCLETEAEKKWHLKWRMSPGEVQK